MSRWGCGCLAARIGVLMSSEIPLPVVDLSQAIGMLHAANQLGLEIQKAMPLTLWT